MTAAPILLRPMTPADHKFVFNSWVRSYGDSAWAKMCGQAYRAGHDALIERLVRASVGLVACYERDPETILGWSVTDKGVVHYVYVKKDFRRNGIARTLLTPFAESHMKLTHLAPGHDWTMPSRWHFDPYPLMVAA